MRPDVELYLHYNQQLDVLLAVTALIGLVIFLAATWRSKRVPSHSWGDKQFWGLLLPVAFVLRVPLFLQSLWYDETFTQRLASIPLQNFIPAFLGDVHPPGYYALVRLFGDSPVAIRLPSLVAGMVLIWLVYRLALLLHEDKHSAQLAAAIVCFLPAMLYYSGEARYPAVLACLVLTSMIALLSGKPLLFALSTPLIAWLHASGMVYVAFLCIAALVRFRWRWTAAALYAAVIAGLWLPGLLIQSSDVQNGFWLTQQLPLWHIVDMTVRQGAPALPLVLLTWSVPLALSLLGMWAARDWLKTRLIWVAVAVGVPLALWLVGYVWHPVYLSRALIAPALLLVVCWGWYLSRVRSWGWYAVVVGFVLTVPITTVYLYTTDRSDLDDLFRVSCSDSDVIYTTSTNMAIMAMSYAPQPSYTWRNGNNQHQSLSERAREAMGFQFADVADLSGRVCMVSQVSYYTTDAEMELINFWHQNTHARMNVIRDDLFSYVIMRFQR